MRTKLLSFPTPVKSLRVSAVADVDLPHPAMVRYALVRRELEQIRSRNRLAAAVEQLVQLAEGERLHREGR